MSIFEEQADQPKQEQPQGEQTPQEETPQEQETTPPKREDSQFDQMLSGITNDEGKPKYSSVQQALGSIPHAQKHIKQLEQDNQALKDQVADLEQKLQEYQEQVNRQLSVEELLEERNKQEISPEAIEEYVNRTLTQREQQALARANTTKVANSLVEIYGDKSAAEKEFMAMQEELGIDLAELSARSPKAVLRYFEKQKPKAPDNFTTQTRANFKPNEQPRKAKMPSTTAESVAAWRESAEAVKTKYNL